MKEIPTQHNASHMLSASKDQYFIAGEVAPTGEGGLVRNADRGCQPCSTTSIVVRDAACDGRHAVDGLGWEGKEAAPKRDGRLAEVVNVSIPVRGFPR
jgi:hypothetical protein